MRKAKAQGTRKPIKVQSMSVVGYYRSLTKRKKVSFSVLAESRESLIRFLVYDEVDRNLNGIYTEYTCINGQELTREEVEKAIESLEEHNGLCSKTMQLIAIESVYRSLFD